MPSVPDYTEVRHLGQGGFGSVWMVRDQTGYLCAIKVVRRSRRDKGYAFKREFAALENYRPIADGHPHILRILHIGKGPGFLYYTVPLADAIDAGPVEPASYRAKTLAAVLGRRRRIPVDVAVHNIILPLLEAVGYIHKHGLLHRDIKPDNILFLQGKPVLGDIGLMAVKEVATTTVGTVGYMPPGGCRKPADDLYAVAKTLYVLITGYPPDRYPDAPSLLDKGSTALFPQVNAVVNEACRGKYKSAAGLGAALQWALGTRPEQPSDDRSPPRSARARRAEADVANERRIRRLESRVKELSEFKTQAARREAAARRHQPKPLSRVVTKMVSSAADAAATAAATAVETVRETAEKGLEVASDFRDLAVAIGTSTAKVVQRALKKSRPSKAPRRTLGGLPFRPVKSPGK